MFSLFSKIGPCPRLWFGCTPYNVMEGNQGFLDYIVGILVKPILPIFVQTSANIYWWSIDVIQEHLLAALTMRKFIYLYHKMWWEQGRTAVLNTRLYLLIYLFTNLFRVTKFTILSKGVFETQNVLIILSSLKWKTLEANFPNFMFSLRYLKKAEKHKKCVPK